MRRLLMFCAVAVLTLVGFSALAIAQKSSVERLQLPAGSAGAYVKPEASLQGIESSKQVVIVATGIAPRALAVDRDGHVFLTNATAANRVFTLTGLSELGAKASANVTHSTRLAPIAGDGVAGSLGDGGGPLAAQFDLRLDSLVMRGGIAVGADGTIFIADTLNSTIRRIAGSDSPEPDVVRSIAGRWAPKQSTALKQPLGVAIDRAGNLYVADGMAGTVSVLPFALDSAPGEQRVEVLAHVASAASIALTADGRQAFVASLETGAVLVIDTQTRALRSLTAFPPQRSASDGQSANVCAKSGGSEEAPSAVCPAGLAVDGAGNLFVADVNAGRILRLDAKTSALTTAATGLQSPGDITFDASGNLYVAEQGANRIVKFISMGADPSNLAITMPVALPPPPAPRVCPTMPAFNFCDEPMGGSTPTQVFTLTNNNSAAVSGLAISFVGTNPGDFQASSNTCGTSLAAGASCSINVDFAPTATGARSATLTVTDSTNATDNGTANVSGTGDDYQLQLNGSPMEQSVIQGGILKFNFNIVPDSVFGGDVTIQCPSNLPSLSTCTPSAPTVTVTPGTPAQFSVTFETTFNGVLGAFPTNGAVPLIFVHPPRKTPPGASPPLAWILGAFAAFLLLTLILWLRLSSAAKARGARVLWIPAVALGAILVFLGGCKHSSVPANKNTPAGSTTLTIQGTTQNAGRGITIILDVTPRG